MVTLSEYSIGISSELMQTYWHERISGDKQMQSYAYASQYILVAGGRVADRGYICTAVFSG